MSWLAGWFDQTVEEVLGAGWKKGEQRSSGAHGVFIGERWLGAGTGEDKVRLRTVVGSGPSCSDLDLGQYPGRPGEYLKPLIKDDCAMSYVVLKFT